uniref:Uncharacterized protein n=1 Tax=Solanum tuberosum TaxID=4113 RepID=M1DVM2_SOLTU
MEPFTGRGSAHRNLASISPPTQSLRPPRPSEGHEDLHGPWSFTRAVGWSMKMVPPTTGPSEDHEDLHNPWSYTRSVVELVQVFSSRIMHRSVADLKFSSIGVDVDPWWLGAHFRISLESIPLRVTLVCWMAYTPGSGLAGCATLISHIPYGVDMSPVVLFLAGLFMTVGVDYLVGRHGMIVTLTS